MANLRVIAEIKPAGDFPVVDAPNVSVAGGKRLDVALSEAAAEVAKKANKSEVDTALASKANKSEVDAALAGKANKSEVDAAIENKADKSAFEAINASVSVNTSNIQELSTESTVLSARMDEFTKLKEGSTTGDAELIDGRIGSDGKTYDNIGGAIRGQVTDLKSDLKQEHDNFNRYMSDERINLVDKSSPEYLTGKGFSGKTGNIIDTSLYYITNYIKISAVDNVYAEVVDSIGAFAFFTHEVGGGTYKVAVYDNNKNWIKTIAVDETPYDTAWVNFGINGYIRLMSVSSKSTNVYTDNYAKIKSDMIEPDEYADFSKYTVSDEFINLVDKSSSDYLVGYGVSGTTGNIVEAAMYDVTNYIPIKSKSKFKSVLSIGGTDYLPFSTSKPNYPFKVLIYDKNKKWVKTVITSETPYSSEWVDFENSGGYIRVQFQNRLTNLRIFDYNIRKINSDFVSGLDNTGVNSVYDVIMFMGQSNMAGRGVTNSTWTESAPSILPNAGYEYRAISDPSKLYAIAEPFGRNENKTDAIDDSTSKTGSMVTSFVNAYYKGGKVPVIAVSASEGGTTIQQWQPNTAKLNDAIERFNNCITYLNDNNYKIRHKYMVWCQGESNGDAGTDKATYKTLLMNTINAMISAGIEKCFIVRIGNCNIEGSYDRYSDIISAQTELAQTEKNVVMVSTDLAGMRVRGLMKDQFHYYQAGYNEVGTYAGVNASIYATTGKEPTMYDTQDGTLYFSHKN